MRFARPVLTVALAFMLSGCAMYRLEELRQAKPTGNAFQTALARMYMDLATQMEKGYDWVPSWHFAEKGLMLAYGHNVAPEDLADWNIPQSALPALQQARGQLLVALSPANETAQPEAAARAQINFDCWVRYQDANWQMDRINECHQNFESALSQIQAPPAPPPVVEKEIPAKPEHPHHKKAKAKKPVKETKPMASAAPETISYVIFFEPGKTQIASVSRDAIAEIEQTLAHQSGYEVVIHGAEGKKADPLLADERIETVKKRLVKGGVNAAAINAAGFGMSKPKSKEGPIRKRVDIFINE